MEFLYSIPPWLVVGAVSAIYDFYTSPPDAFKVLAIPLIGGVTLVLSYLSHKVLSSWVLSLTPSLTDIPYLVGLVVLLRGSIYLANKMTPTRMCSSYGESGCTMP